MTNRRATERHQPYGITQCYLPPDTGERAPTYHLPVFDLRTAEGWKAELTLVLIIYQEIIYQSADGLLSSRPHMIKGRTQVDLIISSIS